MPSFSVNSHVFEINFNTFLHVFEINFHANLHVFEINFNTFLHVFEINFNTFLHVFKINFRTDTHVFEIIGESAETYITEIQQTTTYSQSKEATDHSVASFLGFYYEII